MEKKYNLAVTFLAGDRPPLGMHAIVYTNLLEISWFLHDVDADFSFAVEVLRGSSVSDQRVSATLSDFCLLTCGNLCLFSYFSWPCCVLSHL